LTYQVGYLTRRESSIWDLRRRKLKQSEIGRRLGITRQAVHKALGIIDSKVEQAFREAAETNKLEIRSLNLVDGIMEAYSPAYQIPVIVSLSRANGLKVWHLYEGNCAQCGYERSCRQMLSAEAGERGIELTGEDRRMPPTHLALKIFSRYRGEDPGND
jgi:predicted transcriptional regulator